MQFDDELEELIFNFLLKEGPEGVHTSRIAEALGRNLPTVSQRCQLMEARGILTLKVYGNTKVYSIKKTEGKVDGE